MHFDTPIKNSYTSIYIHCITMHHLFFVYTCRHVHACSSLLEAISMIKRGPPMWILAAMRLGAEVTMHRTVGGVPQ